jgi:hypothetical protein
LSAPPRPGAASRIFSYTNEINFLGFSSEEFPFDDLGISDSFDDMVLIRPPLAKRLL